MNTEIALLNRMAASAKLGRIQLETGLVIAMNIHPVGEWLRGPARKKVAV